MKLASVFLPLFLAAHVHAWNDTGHNVIALVAYERLTPAARANVNSLLAAHPHYERLRKVDASAGTYPKLSAFLQASIWSDRVRPSVGPKKVPESITRYKNASWHYVNLPYIWPADVENSPRSENRGVADEIGC